MGAAPRHFLAAEPLRDSRRIPAGGSKPQRNTDPRRPNPQWRRWPDGHEGHFPVGRSSGRGGRACRRGLAHGQRPVPRRYTGARRPRARGGGGRLPRHHRLLRLAMADRGQRPRPAADPGRCGRGLLPERVSKPHASGRRRRGRAPRRAPRARGAEPRPCPAGRRLGAHRRTVRPGTADRRGPLADAFSAALVDPLRGPCAGRGGSGRRPRRYAAKGTPELPVGARAERDGRGHLQRSAR